MSTASLPPRIEIYTTRYCGYCRAARNLLDELGHAYREIDVTHDPALRAEIIERTGWPTVPVVLVDGELVGGYTDMAARIKAGTLFG
jgi:glutaredoxin 3